MRVAIIGTGISGSLAARLLATEHEVTVYEASGYPGGHANTVDVSLLGQSYPVDTGFMVFNQRTYPNFCRLLDLLNVPSRPSDMSFSVRCSRTGLEYQSSSLNGLFAQRSNALRPSYLGMLRDILRFYRRGNRAVRSGELRDGRTVGQFLDQCGVGSAFLEHYLTPMAAAIWSARPGAILDFPAEFMIGFFANHGLMQLGERPQWRTIVGGSRRYVTALLSPIVNRLRLRVAAESVSRGPEGVYVAASDGSRELFDRVVLATHADQSLALLTDASELEREILGAFPYQPNDAVLHTDTRLLPKRRRAWASWNYHVRPGSEHCASVTYDLSRLQNHETPTPILLTLNATDSIDPSRVLRRFNYQHPAYSRESIAAQQRYEEISGRNNTYYCGAYWGYGFHEDGVNSALAVSRDFGIGLEACTVASTRGPSPITA